MMDTSVDYSDHSMVSMTNGSSVSPDPNHSSSDDHSYDHDEVDGESKDNLIINYLPPNASEADVRSLFAPFGNIEKCKVVVDKLTGLSLGYGFVKYDNEASALAAIAALNGYRMGSKRLKVALAKISVDRQTLSSRTNLYFSGLPDTWTKNQLSSLVNGFGSLLDCRVLADPVTGKGKGVGFARLDNEKNALSCIAALNGTTLPGSTVPLICKFADTTKDKIRKALIQRGNGSSSGSMSSNGSQMSMNSMNSLNMLHNGSQNNASFPHTQSNIDASSFPAAIHSFPSANANQQLAGTVAPFFYPTAGFPAPNTAAAAAAVAATLNNPAGRRTQKILPSYNHQQPAQLGRVQHMRSSSNNNGNDSNAFSGICLFVYHLPPEADENVLVSLFSPFGGVLSTRVIRDLPTGKSKGFGFVNYMDESQANAAINALNGFQLGNKFLKVSYKK